MTGLMAASSLKFPFSPSVFFIFGDGRRPTVVSVELRNFSFIDDASVVAPTALFRARPCLKRPFGFLNLPLYFMSTLVWKVDFSADFGPFPVRGRARVNILDPEQ